MSDRLAGKMLVIAVLSDIHSNYVSLQKCLDYAINAGADSFLFLGDYAGEFACPQKTMDILYSLKDKYRCFFVKGNKEDYWIDYEKKPEGWKEYDPLWITILMLIFCAGIPMSRAK